MKKQQLVTVIGLAGALFHGLASAQDFSLPSLIRMNQGIAGIGVDPDDGESAQDATSGTIMLTDGSTLAISSPDGTTPLSQLLDDSSATLLIDDAPATLSTSAPSLASLNQASGDPAPFAVSTTVASRPLTLSRGASPDAAPPFDSFDVVLNGEPFTIELPEGTTVSDFSASTPITIRDADGNVLLDDRALNSLTTSEANDIAAGLGLLDVDMALRSAQKQAVAKNFGIIANQIDASMHPHQDGRVDRVNGRNAWVSHEYSDMQGQAGNTDYDGEGSVSMVGVDWKGDKLLAGVALGHGEVEIDSKRGRLNTDLGGNLIAPYGAVSLADGDLVLDGILMYQDLDGSSRASYQPDPVALDGHRWGGRAAGTYFLPEVNNLLFGITAGGAYMKDDIEGAYLGSTSDYGIELGEVFAGATLSTDFATGRLYGSLIHHHDVTANFDDSAEVLDDDDKRTELKIGAAHELADNLDVSLDGRTVIGSSDTEFSAVQASLSYRF